MRTHRFSYLLLRVAITLTIIIVAIDLLLRRPVIDSALFGLAIDVGDHSAAAARSGG